MFVRSIPGISLLSSCADERAVFTRPSLSIPEPAIFPTHNSKPDFDQIDATLPFPGVTDLPAHGRRTIRHSDTPSTKDALNKRLGRTESDGSSGATISGAKILVSTATICVQTQALNFTLTRSRSA